MRFLNLGVGTERHDYQPVWELQRELHQGVVAGTAEDTVILVEHTPVLTAGRRTNAADRSSCAGPLVEVDRGGKITWHGPGQLVAYPIIKLAEPVDVVSYVRALEESVLQLLTTYSVPGMRVEGRSGVWVPASGDKPDRKVAAVGVRVAKGITMHGIAINADPDLSAFSTFTPCGISDAGVTSLSAETGVDISPTDILAPVTENLRTTLTRVLASTTDKRHEDHVNHTEADVVPHAAHV